MENHSTRESISRMRVRNEIQQIAREKVRKLEDYLDFGWNAAADNLARTMFEQLFPFLECTNLKSLHNLCKNLERYTLSTNAIEISNIIDQYYSYVLKPEKSYHTDFFTLHSYDDRFNISLECGILFGEQETNNINEKFVELLEIVGIETQGEEVCNKCLNFL